jgi:hypothetical protein
MTLPYSIERCTAIKVKRSKWVCDPMCMDYSKLMCGCVKELRKAARTAPVTAVVEKGLGIYITHNSFYQILPRSPKS